jgi:hypothetical protein
MVHALEESWRVLVPDGYLLDTRPLSGDMRVEVIADGQAKFAGLVDDSAWAVDDEASAQALEVAIQRELFLKEEETNFTFCNYWNTLEQMRAYTREKWEEIHLPDTVWRNAEDLVKQSEGKTRVRISVKMLFSRYRKLNTP